MATGWQYYVNEAQYLFQRTFRWGQAKAIQIGLRTAMGGGAAAVATDLSYPVREVMNLSQPGFAAGAQAAMTTGEILLSSTGGLVSIGLGAGISAYINQMELRHNERQLTELYRPQVASLTGKQPGLVTVKDLYAVAEQNPSLDEELRRYKRDRTIKNIGGAVGTLAAFGVVLAMVTFLPAVGALATAAAVGGFLSGPGLAFAALAGGAGYASLQVARKAVTGIGRKLFGLDEPSVEDKLSQLSRQQRKDVMITPAQVMDVHLTAHPHLAEEIETQYGAPFRRLSPEARRMVIQQHDEELELTETARALAEGRMNVRELTFKVHGQFSGVYPEAPWQEKLKERAQVHGEALQQKLGGIKESAADRIQQWQESRELSRQQDEVAKAVDRERGLQSKEESSARWQDFVASGREQQNSPKGPAI